MRQVRMCLFIILLAFVVHASMTGNCVLLAQAPNNKQKYEETVRSARQIEIISYILAGAGILLVVASIPYAIYKDRQKKARKQAAQKAADAGRSGDSVERKT